MPPSTLAKKLHHQNLGSNILGGSRNKAGVPVEARVAAIFRQMMPGLPIPVMTVRCWHARISSTARLNVPSTRSARAGTALPSIWSTRLADAIMPKHLLRTHWCETVPPLVPDLSGHISNHPTRFEERGRCYWITPECQSKHFFSNNPLANYPAMNLAAEYRYGKTDTLLSKRPSITH